MTISCVNYSFMYQTFFCIIFTNSFSISVFSIFYPPYFFLFIVTPTSTIFILWQKENSCRFFLQLLHIFLKKAIFIQQIIIYFRCAMPCYFHSRVKFFKRCDHILIAMDFSQMLFSLQSSHKTTQLNYIRNQKI